MEIVLEWKGPFSLASPEDRRVFAPPSEGGVYLWCVGGDANVRAAYVGQASKIGARMYQHISSTLGGAYRLYSDAHLIECDEPKDPVYEPSLNSMLTVFLDDPEEWSAKAVDNLMKYRILWAAVGGDASIRKAVESALIKRLKDRGEPLQNGPVSIGHGGARKVTVQSHFQTGFELPPLREAIEYGTR